MNDGTSSPGTADTWRDGTHGSAAAYVLGALEPAQKSAFEDHLATCPDCRQAVGELSGLPALLSRVDPAELEEPPPTPETLLPRLLGEVRRSRRRRRLVTWGTTAAAAILAIALGSLLVLQRDDSPAGLRMQQVSASAPIHATAALSSETWGTRIRLRCSYESYPQTRSEETYRLVVTNVHGVRRTVSTWTAVPGQVSTITGSVEWMRRGISNVAVVEADGTKVLTLALS
jgi:hypothetical protein